MQHLKSAVIVMALVGLVVGEDNDTLACCPPSNYILVVAGATDVCWNETTNVTAPIKFQCDLFIKNSDFKIVEGNVQITLHELHKPLFGREEACTGTMIRKLKNGTVTAPKTIAILCYREDKVIDEHDLYIRNEVLAYCMIASVVFLAITAIIYSCFQELRDLFGKSIINLCTSLGIGLGILSIINLMPYEDMNMCATRGFLSYFFTLAAFFWSNSISIQVLRDTRRPCTVDYGWHEFRWFVLYSWGVPVVFTVIMAIVNYHPGDHERPGIGLNHCWFFSKEQQWYYMYSVITILLLINAGIFIYISTMVWRHTFSSSHLKAVKFKTSMTIRLIVVMGLTWIFEMISSLVEASMFWGIMDIVNCSQGLLLFLILVVFRKRVIRAMYKRGWCPCCSGLVERYLAVGDDAEENVVQHTDIPMNDDRTIA